MGYMRIEFSIFGKNKGNLDLVCEKSYYLIFANVCLESGAQINGYLGKPYLPVQKNTKFPPDFACGTSKLPTLRYL